MNSPWFPRRILSSLSAAFRTRPVTASRSWRACISGLAPANHKRVYRIMKNNNLLFERSGFERPEGHRIFARQLGLKRCFTPVASPQSNGMSEALMKTLKRDYVRVNPMPDAETVLRLIGDWIEDYNKNHPHSGLKWRAAREFIKAKTKTA